MMMQLKEYHAKDAEHRTRFVTLPHKNVFDAILKAKEKREKQKEKGSHQLSKERVLHHRTQAGPKSHPVKKWRSRIKRRITQENDQHCHEEKLCKQENDQRCREGERT
jgi:hypothetical protein